MTTLQEQKAELAQNTAHPNIGRHPSTNGHPPGVTNGNGTVHHHQHGQTSHWDYGGNPLAHANTGDSARLPAFGGFLQPGLYRPPKTNIANPAPLGLVAFAFTTFVLSLFNWHTRNIATPSIIIGPAFAYGGLVQLLAGMW
jgi:hypothetical protein